MQTMINLGDPELELMDPTPNVHTLFIHFDKMFFWTKLASRAVVRWSKRMYSCAGICSYEGRGGLCDIALSEPLLKLRPRKDLIETLLHEMIHAFLFVTNRDQDRDGHGPNFQSHMHRINKSAGLNISIYHSFHDEVKLYQTHWWRCNGRCQTVRPHFGIVRRSMNRAPGPNDYWWDDHKRKCGGTFIKIKEPEKKTRGKAAPVTKPNADITRYITSNIKTINNIPNTSSNSKPVLKDSTNSKTNTNVRSNSSSTLVVSKKGVVFNPTSVKPSTKPPVPPIPVFTGSGQTIPGRPQNTDNVTETVRNIWANKQIPSKTNSSPVLQKKVKAVETSTKPNKAINQVEDVNSKKHKADTNIEPPAKIKKINDHMNATSILKDLYGEDYKLTQSNDSKKLIAVHVKVDLVACPICNAKFSNEDINKHLDECLNKDIIEKLSKDEIVEEVIKPSTSRIDSIPAKVSVKPELIDLTWLHQDTNSVITKGKRKTESQATLQSVDINNMISEVKDNNRRRSDSFITKERGDYLSNETKMKKVEEVVDEPKAGPSTEKEIEQICPCCGVKFDKPVEEHLEECLTFFDNNSTIPDEGASTSYSNNTTILIDDEEDDIFDETQVLNATGTKTPCPCCMEMMEIDDMNAHLDICLK
ncbi:unnamed protein product [Spodoptera littoralis]|uniref:Protein with SprT-like domain at the N terminus n=1 Tax=Spodoptera littoralis TaxID=7109 RepID=A0A9P0IIB8_SPOLI|nr:unnamed protein product [Spodoptera littoralis]CAH1646432.1 unnamed protein product [Spodoptera littoralis]